jgi:hypothetical protein
MQSVKIGATEYKAIKALAKKRGQFITFLLNEAIRFYLSETPAERKP